MFATDKNEGPVKIAFEGDDLLGNTVRSFHFTADHAGEDLSFNKASPGLNKNGLVAFLVTLDPGVGDVYTALVKASFEGEFHPSGNDYIWDGGAGTTNWHTVVNERSNWVDYEGVPWDKPPDSPAAKVVIGDEFLVELTDQLVQVDTVTLGASSLEINKALECENFVNASALSSIVMKSGSLQGKTLSTSGALIKEGPGTFFLVMDNHLISDTDLAVEDGTLTIWGETRLNDSPIVVEDATIIVSGHIRFRGESGLLSTSGDSKVTFDNSAMLTFETDTTFMTGEGSTISIGNGDFELQGTYPMEFKTEFAEENRVLEIVGNGRVEILDPILVSENGIVRNKSGSASRPGLIVDTYDGDDFQEVVFNGLFENIGTMDIPSGGVKGNFVNKGTLLITNAISQQPPISLDCENKGTLKVTGGFGYGSFVAKLGSKLILDQDNVRSIFPLDIDGDGTLHFENGATITAKNATSKIKFPTLGISSPSFPNLEADIVVEESAELVFEKANTGASNIIDVNFGGKLKFNELQFEELTTQGEGRTTLSGDILPDSDDAKMIIGTQLFTIENAKLFGVSPGRSISEILRENVVYQLNRIGPGDQSGEIRETHFSDGAYVHGYENTKIYMENGVILDSTITVEGTCFLSGSLAEGQNGGHLRIGFARWIGPVNETILNEGRLEVLGGLADSVVISPALHIRTFSEITVGELSHLIIEDMIEIDPSSLLGGIWKIEDFAACEIVELPTGIARIGNVSIGRPHATLPSIVNLPNQQNDLTIFRELTIANTKLKMNGNDLVVNAGATLTLMDSILDMGGGALGSSGKVNQLGNSKIIGNVKVLRGVHSISNEVIGPVQLAGAFNIEGSLEIDGLLRRLAGSLL